MKNLVFASKLLRIAKGLVLGSSLPADLSDTDPGMMTWKQYLKSKNIQEKHHPSSAYRVNLKQLNGYDLAHIGETHDRKYTVHELSGTPLLVFMDESQDIKAIYNKGTLYVSHDTNKKNLQNLKSYRNLREIVYLDIQDIKVVKYPEELLNGFIASYIPKYNVSNFSHVLQNVVLGGERFTLCCKKKPIKDAGEQLVLINEDGYIVGSAQNEWGATLLMIVEEYQGKGLGSFLVTAWDKYNPSWDSGGFTSGGESTRLRFWNNRVKEFLSNGWYSELIKQGRLTKTQVDDILSGLSGKASEYRLPEPKKSSESESPDILIFTDPDSSAFAVYDARFLDDQDEKYIHGYGFFRDHPKTGWYVYSIDYDRPYAKLTTQVALQLAKDQNEPLYVGEGYADFLEWQDIEHVKKEGDHISLTENVLDLNRLSKREKSLRAKKDKYDEIKTLLMEMGEAKW